MSMKIRYLPNEEKQNIRPLYEAIFEDPKDYVDYLFAGPIFKNDVLVLEENEKICSMLQLVPKKMVYQGMVCDVHYIFAVATAKDERKKGYMEQLLERACADLRANGEPFTYLVPVNPEVYKKFDFRVVYLKFKYKFQEESKQIRVYHPNKMDNVILQKFCESWLQKKYDTYLLHDEAYFDKLFKEIEIEKGYLIYHSEEQRMNGYTIVSSGGEIIESVWMKRPQGIILSGYTPWIMVKTLKEDCRIGRVYINDET